MPKQQLFIDSYAVQCSLNGEKDVPEEMKLATDKIAQLMKENNIIIKVTVEETPQGISYTIGQSF